MEGAKMPAKPRVPVVTAYAVITGRSYESLLEEYDAMTPEQQAMADELYVSNNMGYGLEAWQAYLDAESESLNGREGVKRNRSRTAAGEGEAKRDCLTCEAEPRARFEVHEMRLREERHRKREEGPRFVQSFITNATAPKTLDELYEITRVDGYCPSMDAILYMWRGEPIGWTVPGWAKVGDVVFFMHSKTSNSLLTAMRSELALRENEFGPEDLNWLRFWINHELDVHKLYGGKIYAIGRVAGKPYKDSGNHSHQHWGSCIYADIDDVQMLTNPIDISEFNGFIHVSRQNAITPVFGEKHERLMGLIAAKNRIPKRFKGLNCDPMPLSRINERNWLDVLRRHRRSFFLEQQFRTYCVDHFLRAFGEKRTFYAEGRCRKAGHPDTFVDNLVLYRGRWLPVEVKLDIALTHNLEAQLEQYMDVDDVVVKKRQDQVVFERDELWLDRVMVVDTEGLYLYYGSVLRYLLLWDEVNSIETMLSALRWRLESVCDW